jgi:hypothetical protein
MCGTASQKILQFRNVQSYLFPSYLAKQSAYIKKQFRNKDWLSHNTPILFSLSE